MNLIEIQILKYVEILEDLPNDAYVEHSELNTQVNKWLVTDLIREGFNKKK